MRFDDLGPGERCALHFGATTLVGDLTVPEHARGIILFVRGGGSSRSPRDAAAADRLHGEGFGTLWLDLLTAEERAVDEFTRRLRYDVGLLGARVVAAVDWIGRQDATEDLPIGILGSSIGAAAALVAAADRPGAVAAVVSRGGRPDLAGEALERVRCPTLLVVGGQDTVLEECNVEALNRMSSEVGMAVVPRATHLFEDDGDHAEATAHAVDWFDRHLVRWVSRSGVRLVDARLAPLVSLL